MRLIALALCVLVFSNWALGQEKKAVVEPKTAQATFAGGCFWCMEPPFDELNGVISTVSGYTGGAKDNPTYKEVSEGGSGHKEVLQVTYDPSKVSYEKLVSVFWKNIDPFDDKGQFCDKGSQYTSAIYFQDDEQKKIALQSKEKLFDSADKNTKVVTEILRFKKFFDAEDYHQDYYKKNPVRYKFYRYNCGRDKRLKEVWGETKK